MNIRPSDRAIYVGTWRVQRGEFNDVTDVQVLDHYSAALSELRRRFGAVVPLRKALPKWGDMRKTAMGGRSE